MSDFMQYFHINNIWTCCFLLTLIAELLLGTVYLMFISIAFLITSLLYYFNVSIDFETNLVITAIFIIIAIICAYYTKQKISNNDAMDIDVGNFVVIDTIQKNGYLGVKYRGAMWQAKMSENNVKYDEVVGKAARIIKEDGNVLIIKLI